MQIITYNKQTNNATITENIQKEMFLQTSRRLNRHIHR